MKERWVTIEDVAAAAGVSVATVSRALRDLPHVAPSTRQRVQSVARELNYRPDPSASALAAGRTRVVAMAVPMLDGWYFSRVMAGAEAVLARAGYDLLVTAVDGNDRRRRLLGGPFARRVDGLILADLRIPQGEAVGLLGGPSPVVTIGIDIPGTSSVMVDDLHIAEQAVGHLIGHGHRAIALIEGSWDDPLRFTVPEQRRLGYLAALRAAGIEPRPEYEVRGDFSVESGREAMAELLDLPDPPTGVFAMSDEMAYGALGEVWDRGLDTPGHVSIIGVDDHEFSEVVGLSTVAQPVTEHGARAAELLLGQLSGTVESPVRHEATTRLIARRTTGPAPAPSSPR